MSKILLTDNTLDIATKMSEGNPGALNFVMELVSSGEPKRVINLLRFDTMEFYGSDLYMIWNDCCGRDFKTFDLLCLNIGFGKITKNDIEVNLKSGRGKPFNLLSESELTF